MTEVDRALRDVKADLAATRRRMGHITGGISGMSGTAKNAREFRSTRDLEGMVLGLDLVMKAGRKAA